MAKRRGRGDHDTLGIVLLVLGILFTLSGVGALAEGMVVSSASAQFGGMLGNLGATEEAMGAVLLVIGILMIIAGVRLRRR